MAERTTGGDLPRWFPLLTAGIALFNLLEGDWLGVAIWSACTIAFMLPNKWAGRRWVLVARTVLGAAMLVFLALLIRNDF